MARSKHKSFQEQSTPEVRFRAALCALLFVLGLITLVCVRASLDWIDKPFNGFLMGRNRIVAPIDLPSWSGRSAGIPYWWQLTAINGATVSTTSEAQEIARRAGKDASLQYAFSNGSTIVERTIPVMVFTVADWVGLFANYLINGLALLAIGFFVVFLRPDLKSARALLFFSLSWGTSLIIGLADFSSFHFRSILAVAEAFVPASLFYLTLCFPTERPLPRYRRRLHVVVTVSALMAALNIVLYDATPILWTYVYRAGVIWVVAVLGLSIHTAWREQRNLATIEREKIKVVLLGMLAAFALPFVVLAASHLVGAELPLNIVTAGWWIFPATLAYAIVQRDLFEIDVFLRRVATYIALSAIVFFLYTALLATLSQGVYSLELTASPWFALLFSLTVLALFHPLRDRLQKAVDRLFFRTHFDYAETTREISQAFNQSVSAEYIAGYVSDVSQRTMAPTSSAIFRPFADGFQAICIAPGGEVGAPIHVDPQTRDALTRGRVLDGDLLPPATRTELPTTALLLPLLFEDHLEGFLHLGPKNSGTPYGPRDVELLRTLSNQTAMALRNAASYDRVTELLASLETRVEERTRELEHTQRELRESNEKLRELDRVKTQFFADASHELRTPLTLVLGPLEELGQAAEALPPSAQRQITLARANAATLLVLTDTLLDISRIDSAQMTPSLQPEALRPLLEATLEPFRWLAEQKGVDLLLECDDEVYIRCDRNMMTKILGNLLANGLKFTNAGNVAVSAAMKGEDVIISIADTGPGIPDDELSTIFERYHQGSNAGRASFSGSGIGLALVREFSDIQGGSVSVSSSVGGGSVFRLTFPTCGESLRSTDTQLQQPAAARKQLEILATSAMPVPSRGQVKPLEDTRYALLLVDDNPEITRFLSDILASDYALHCAQDSAAALSLIKGERIDLIVSDIMMPGPDGIALCRTLKSDPATRHIPLILLTARASLDSKVTGFAAGADDYITKPFHPDEVKARIAALLRLHAMQRQLQQSHEELSEAYDQLRKAQAQLVHSEKMASLGTLVAGVAHEINNPVSFIHSSIDLISGSVNEVRELLDRHLNVADQTPEMQALREDIDSEERFATLLDNAAICREGARRAALIVQDLRVFSRPDIDGRESIDIHESIDQSLRLVQGESHGRITIKREYGILPKLTCNPGQMSQVFLNILANAVQAIPDRGTITVATHNGGDQIAVRVRDNGSGMSEETQKHLFDPFFTTKEVGQGTGLGLSIVRSLVHSHGGDIQVESKIGEGTTFTVTLPTNGESA